MVKHVVHSKPIKIEAPIFFSSATSTTVGEQLSGLEPPPSESYDTNTRARFSCQPPGLSYSREEKASPPHRCNAELDCPMQ